VPSMTKSDLIITNIAISVNKSALFVNKSAPQSNKVPTQSKKVPFQSKNSAISVQKSALSVKKKVPFQSVVKCPSEDCPGVLRVDIYWTYLPTFLTVESTLIPQATPSSPSMGRQPTTQDGGSRHSGL